MNANQTQIPTTSSLAELGRTVLQNSALTLPFMRALIHSKIWVAGKTDGPLIGKTGKPNERLLLHTLIDEGVTYIPFYSDVDTLQSALNRPKPHFSMPAKMLFERSRGKHLIFNYLTDQAVILPPRLIELFLARKYDELPTTENLGDCKFAIFGTPGQYPHELTDPLIALFINRDAVKQAYLTVRTDLMTDEGAVLFIGVVVDRDDATLADDIDRIIVTHQPKEALIKVLWLDESKHYERTTAECQLLAECEPFYHRSWGRMMRGSE